MHHPNDRLNVLSSHRWQKRDSGAVEEGLKVAVNLAREHDCFAVSQEMYRKVLEARAIAHQGVDRALPPSRLSKLKMCGILPSVYPRHHRRYQSETERVGRFVCLPKPAQFYQSSFAPVLLLSGFSMRSQVGAIGYAPDDRCSRDQHCKESCSRLKPCGPLGRAPWRRSLVQREEHKSTQRPRATKGTKFLQRRHGPPNSTAGDADLYGSSLVDH